MSDKIDSWIDESLCALAADDARVAVPPEVEAAVLRAWDLQRAGESMQRPAFRWRKKVGWALVPAATAAVLAVASLVRDPAAVPDSGFSAVEGAGPVAASAVPLVPPRPLEERRVSQSLPRPVAANEGPRPIAETGYVIVPEPFADTTELHLVRVRMSRMALATLGMPTIDPDAEGLVDVDMLVGDDGVARSIRRATFVIESTDRGAER